MAAVAGNTSMSAGDLRRDLSARNLVWAERLTHETTYGSVPCVIYAEDGEGAGHGNFLTASYRRICADREWRRRLSKVYTASRRVARSHDRRRSELECANSSDALLMNLFCYPGILRRPGVCRLLGVDAGLRPEFGVRVQTPLAKAGVDRTEVDMQLGDLLVEAKLTETWVSAGSAGVGGTLSGSPRDLRCRGASAVCRWRIRAVPAPTRRSGGACARTALSPAVRWTPRGHDRELVPGDAGGAAVGAARPSATADLARAFSRGFSSYAGVSGCEVWNRGWRFQGSSEWWRDRPLTC